IIETELALADLESIEKRIQRLERSAKSGDKKAVSEKDFLLRLRGRLSQGESLLGAVVTEEEKTILRDCHLLTDKPVVFAANVDEKEMLEGNDHVRRIEEIAAQKGAGVVTICGKIENELSALPMEEHRAFLEELGLSEPGLYKLIRAGYGLLKLITFFTAGEKEVRAWTVPEGTRAPQAAGQIHSDIERGFIRAEVMRFEDLDTLGSSAAVKEKGLLRLEGKDYVMRDGDVVYFRFHV
ncbi:MAG: redox-regulated ATPase YchF, partial [Nitrospirae bacterium]|nr:redox-regulated ATPase YchF [Nitrospirota bacterium]